MDSGERRRPTGKTARLILLLTANAVALIYLFTRFFGGSEEVSPVPEGGPAPEVVHAATPEADEVRERPGNTRDRDLERRIQTQIANAVETARKRSKGKVNGSNVAVAVHVRELESGAPLAAVQAERSLTPASNMKLLTCAAALVLLGPDWKFETPFEARGEVSGGRLSGDLIARAGGDPMYIADSDGSLDPWLDDLAAQLRTAGIERVSGALVLDEGTFRTPEPGPGWPSKDDLWQEYCALSGGFSANAGCLQANIRPTQVGARAEVRVRPRHHGLERVGTVTTKSSKKLNIGVEARRGRVVVRGDMPKSTSSYQPRFAYPDPVDLFGHAFVGGLGARGIEIAGGYRRERDTPAGERVALLTSTLASMMGPILGDSNNSVADQLFFSTGLAQFGAGTREKGQAAVVKALEELGLAPAGYKQADGSGLSRDNRVTAEQLTALIRAVLARDGGELYRDALPIAGRTKKLARRMRGTSAEGRVRAKTGWINGASSLSGVAECKNGRTLVFSILVHYPRVDGMNTHAWKPMQDSICEILVAYP